MPSQGRVYHHLSAQIGSTVTSGNAGGTGPTDISIMELSNTTAAIAYLQIFWVLAGSVTLGTTVPDVVIGLPANGGAVLKFEGEGWHTGGTSWSMAGTTTRTGLTQALIDVTIWRKA